VDRGQEAKIVWEVKRLCLVSNLITKGKHQMYQKEITPRSNKIIVWIKILKK